MSSDELKEKTFYLVQTPFIKGGPVHVGNRKHLFQHLAIDMYLTEDEIMWYVNEDRTND
jgi:hypothetical protein